MRTSLLKAVAFSIAALVLGGGFAAAPAFAAGAFAGGGWSGATYPLGGGAPGGRGAPEIYAPGGGALSHGGFVAPENASPPGGFAPPGNAVPHAGVSPSGGFKQTQIFPNHPRYRRRHGMGVPIAPGVFGYDYYDNGNYYYDDSYCWIYRRIYNRYGKFVGWRRVYICQDKQ
ncbi:MAG: hypothetical protein ABR878_04005 [Roseiarcus sp.]|jgi:hypothetical protein